jgi:hypothetical protein
LGRDRLAKPLREFGPQQHVSFLGEEPHQVSLLVGDGKVMYPSIHLRPGGLGGGFTGASGRGHCEQLVIDTQKVGQRPQGRRQLRQAGGNLGLALVAVHVFTKPAASGNEASQPR